MRSSTASASSAQTQVATSRVIRSLTLRDSVSPPRARSRTMSRSDRIPSGAMPSEVTTTAPIRRLASSSIARDTGSSGDTVST